MFIDITACEEHDAFLFHQLLASGDDRLVQLHVGDPVHQKAADPVFTLVYMDGMSPVVQHIGCRKSGGTAADHRDLHTASHLRDHGLYKTPGKGFFDQKPLIVMDTDRV